MRPGTTSGSIKKETRLISVKIAVGPKNPPINCPISFRRMLKTIPEVEYNHFPLKVMPVGILSTVISKGSLWVVMSSGGPVKLVDDEFMYTSVGVNFRNFNALKILYNFKKHSCLSNGYS